MKTWIIIILLYIIVGIICFQLIQYAHGDNKEYLKLDVDNIINVKTIKTYTCDSKDMTKIIEHRELIITYKLKQ